MTVKLRSTIQQQDVEDPVEEMLKKTGCMELHYQVQVFTLSAHLNVKEL